MKITISDLFENMFVSEGKHWPEDYKKTAINMIKSSPLSGVAWYSDDLIEQDVDTFVNEFGPLSHKNSNLGYFSTIIKWFIEYTGVDKNKYQEFIERKLDGIIRDLLWLSNSPEEEEKVKEQLKTKWLFDDFEKYQNEVVDKKRNVDIDIKKDILAKYTLIPISSYEQLHQQFGGNKTGYEGKSEWCHTNGESTYDDWVNSKKNKFYILARNDWEKISPPDPETTNAYDTYGTSLIALLVEVDSMKLKNATLRWNHIIEPSETISGTSVDHAFSSFEQLEQLSNLNIQALIEKDLKEEIIKIEKFSKKVNEIFQKALNNLKGIGRLYSFAIEEELKKYSDIDYNEFSNYVTTITIPEGVTIIDSAFSSFEKLTTINLPESLTEIGWGAFSHCINLKHINLPKNLQVINQYAFSHCKSLKEVVLPSTVTRIGKSAFVHCEALTTINLDNVKEIGNYAFLGCKNLTGISFSNKLQSIDSGVFDRCFSLESVVIPDSVKYIRENAFSNCKNLRNVTFGNHLRTIGEYAFSTTNIEKVDLPKTLYNIGKCAFEHNDSLTTVIIRGKVKKINYATFSYCSNLKNVILSDALEEILGMVFYGCTSLESIELPAKIKIIRSSAFSQSGLKTITFKGKTKKEIKAIMPNLTGIKVKIKPNESRQKITYNKLRNYIFESI